MERNCIAILLVTKDIEKLYKNVFVVLVKKEIYIYIENGKIRNCIKNVILD